MEPEDWTGWVAPYCRHQLTAAERRRREAWLRAAEGNREAWRAAVDAYRRGRRVAAWERVDEGAAWERLARGIAAAVAGRRRRWRRFAATATGAAACVAVVVATWVGGVLWRGSDEPAPLSWSTLLPGETRAILRLPDGREMAMGRTVVADTVLGFQGLRDTAGLSYRDAPRGRRGDEAAFHTLVIPRKGEYFLVLSDGSQVWLNADSELRYPSSFGERREVFLSGEAYFNVARDSSRPFIVESPGNRVEALGTRFNVSAYRDEDRVVTTLEEGSVRVIGGGETMVLAPGTRAVATREGLEVSVADASIDIAWIHRTFEFVEMPLGDITRQLQRWYDVEFVYREEGLQRIPFTGTVGRDLPLQEVLRAIERLADITFTLQSNRIEVTEQGGARRFPRP
ncbi:MAG: DUF4974 domain-containing protein [Odoribacteraceae bacterium]|jgi:ferric-dicitrate binding protein FerR (iron transport regulator)|nr:DUF4974 domain-containing protein [Odoribacteraceae bacterium]